jgi:flagellar protein FliO/FliZ
MAAESAAPDMGGSVFRLLTGFALVIGLLLATLWLLKKISVPRGGSGNLVRVVSAAAVGPRERVVLVDVGGKRLVLGVAPGSVALLDTVVIPSAAPSTAQTDMPSQSDIPATPAFAQWLQKIMARRNEK